MAEPDLEAEDPVRAAWAVFERDYLRLRAQALAIGEILRRAGCPSMTLEEGVRWALARGEPRKED
jgi:hypothetical protein